MKKRYLKKVSIQNTSERVVLIVSLLIAGVLGIAAWGKIFYPAELLKVLDRWVSGFEILFLVLIICLRRRWQLWVLAAVVFAGWCGYALYWSSLALPCSCMGALLHIPTALSISIDIFFFAMSLLCAYLLKAKWHWIYLSVLCGLMAGLIGSAFAEWVYKNMVIRL